MVNERIHDFFAWLDNDDATVEDMPSWMGGSDWCEENGTSETWEYVLLRQASNELTQLKTELGQLKKIISECPECDEGS